MMSGTDQLRAGARLETAQAWDSARRLREPVAWTLLAVAAIGLLIGAWELFSLPGAPHIAVPVTVSVPTSAPTHGVGAATTSGFRGATSLGIRASTVAPQFVAAYLFALPIVSVILVAFAGGLTVRARQVVETALGIQIVTLGLGLLSWFGALGAHLRAGIWFIADASELAIVAAGLIFIVAVRHSRALRLPTPQLKGFPEDDEDYEVLGEEVAGAAFEDFSHDDEDLGEELR